MTAPRPPFRRAFPFWALLLWLAVGLSVWPAQALTAPAPSSPALVDDGGLFGQALPRDAGGQPRAVAMPAPAPRFPRYHNSAPRAPPL